MNDMTVVATLHKKNSKLDFTHKGKVLNFEIESCGKGMNVAFVVDLKLKDVMPEHLQPVLARDEDLDRIVGRKAVAHGHIGIKWFEKLTGKTLEQKVLAWARKVQREYKDIEKIAEDIRISLNC